MMLKLRFPTLFILQQLRSTTFKQWTKYLMNKGITTSLIVDTMIWNDFSRSSCSMHSLLLEQRIILSSQDATQIKLTKSEESSATKQGFSPIKDPMPVIRIIYEESNTLTLKQVWSLSF
jgi:hypothetical protein